MVAESMYPTAVATSYDPPPNNYEQGTYFTPSMDGAITGIKFWRQGGTSTTTRGVRLWDVVTQTKLYEAATAETGAPSGWYTYVLPTPLAVFAGRQYCVSFNTVQYNSRGPIPATDDAPHLTPVSSPGFHYGNPGQFPTATLPFYLMADVVFVPAVPLAVVATKTAPDTYQFVVTGVEAAQFTIDYGDGTAAVFVPTHASGTTTLSHTYMVAGHHDYTVRVTADMAPFAATLAQLSIAAPPAAEESFFSGRVPVSDAAGQYECGCRFTPTKPGRLTAIGYYRSPSETLTRRNVTLWTDAGAQIARVLSPTEGAAGWYWVAVSQALTKDTTYRTSHDSLNRLTYESPIPARGAPSLTWAGSRFGQPVGTFPNNDGFNNWYGADVKFRADPTLADLAALPGWPTLGSAAATSEAATVAVSVDVGPATIWATVIPGTPVPTIQVDAYVSSGQNIIGWEVDRDADGKSTTIYVGSAWQQAASFVDELAPLGVPITYRLRITYSDYTAVAVSSAPVIITGTVGCYLTDPNTGDTIAVTLVTWPEREREARRAVLGVLNRADPVALSDQHLTPAGDWTFYTTTDVDTAALVALLTASTFATLRTQPGSSIASVTVSVGNVNERRYSGAGGDARRFVDVEVQEIEPLPATALPLNATLGGLATVDGDTLGKLSQFRDTLLQLSMVVTGVSTQEAAHAFNV